MKHAVPAFVFSFLTLTLAAADPSLVIINGKVWTGDPAKPAAEAIAISGNQIVAVGTTAEIRAMVTDDKKTRVVDAKGRRVIPGINDAHTHPPSGMPWVPRDQPRPVADSHGHSRPLVGRALELSQLTHVANVSECVKLDNNDLFVGSRQRMGIEQIRGCKR